MTNGEIRDALIALAQTMKTHVNKDVKPRVNAFENTMTYRLRGFMKMNHPIFLGFKIG